ncbi:MAG TPA: arylsulfotransferase family protein, partial [Gammaproteobacteria bacterium]|nr:arylsulfotransferase family protein [Gammaproteobacteria bacterium]
DAVAVLDLDKGTMVWALQGSWHRQHDADMLPNGRILLFDNWGHYEPGGASRVIEFNPTTCKIVWTYSGDDQRFFNSRIRSDQERLPNGNTLITESDGGRLIEVTKKGEIVWEYVNPVRGGGGTDLVPVLYFGVHRIAPASLEPSFRESINASNLSVRITGP